MATVLSSYRRMLIVSRAHVLSAKRPDLRDIITRQASGVTKTSGKGKDEMNSNSMHERAENNKRIRKKKWGVE